MNRTLATGALMSSLLLGACATAPSPPPALVEARGVVLGAETDPAVNALAPLELKKATDTLARANLLMTKGEPQAEISSAAYVASQQARTAMAIAQAKGNDTAIAGSEADRERARADMRTLEATRARGQADVARAQTGVAREQAAQAEQRASGAEQRASGAEQRASGAEQQAALALAQAGSAQMQSAELQQRLADLQAQKTERGMLVTLGDVLFESGRSDVKPAAQGALLKLAGFLQQYPNRRILIEGFTDDVGAAAYNQGLSRRRAEAVDAALLGMGVSAQRMATVGYGEEYPVASNTSDTNRAMNRRVEVIIADSDQPVRARR